MNTNSFDKVPLDVVCLILDNLYIRDAISFMSTSKLFWIHNKMVDYYYDRKYYHFKCAHQRINESANMRYRFYGRFKYEYYTKQWLKVFRIKQECWDWGYDEYEPFDVDDWNYDYPMCDCYYHESWWDPEILVDNNDIMKERERCNVCWSLMYWS